METDQDQFVPKVVLKRWVKNAQRPISGVMLHSVAAAFAWIAVAWAIGSITGAIADERAVGVGLWIGLLAVVLRAFFLWRAERAADRAGRATVEAARREILGQVARKGAGVVAGDSAGARVAQIYDRTAKLSGYAAQWVPGMRLAVITPLLILIAAFTQSWLVGVLLAISVLVLPLFIWLTASGTAAAARAQQASLDTLSGAFQARTAQTGIIRAYRAVGRETQTLAFSAETLRQRTMAILARAFLSTAVLEFFASVSIAVVAVYIGFKLLGVFPFPTGETITLSEGMMALVLAPEFFAPIRRLATLHHDRADGTAAADQLAPWLAKTKSLTITRWAPLDHAPAITFNHVGLSRGDEPILRDVMFTASPGELTVLAGPSGSGKTSCLLALLGQVEVSAGVILADKRPLLEGESLAESVAYLRQTPWLTEGSVADNLRIAAPEATDAELRRAAEAAGLDSFLDLDGDGLERPLARFGTGLSGGQRQRLAVARALLREAPLLLLDEPTAHLDADAEARFLDRLTALKDGRTLIIASHRPAVIAAADQLIDLQAYRATKEAA